MAGTATRDELIAAAERLFAERGIEAVSLREIGAAAGQRNNSAAQYHFGGRDGLVDAIFESRMTPIDRHRQAMVEDLEAADRSSDLRALCEAFVLPLVAVAGDEAGPSWYARFLAQVVFDPDFDVLARRRRAFTSGLRRVITLLETCLGHMPPAVRGERLELAATLVVHGLAHRERTRQNAGRRRDPLWAVFVADLVDAMVGVLSAPVSATTRSAARAATRRSA